MGAGRSELGGNNASESTGKLSLQTGGRLEGITRK